MYVESCDYNASGSTLQDNVLAVINSFTTVNEEQAFEAWVDNNNIYIQCLIRGYTPTYNRTFAQGYGGKQITDGNVGYNNANTYASKSGSGVSAADNSNGTIPASMFGWICLDTTTQTLSGRGKYSVHTIANFPTQAAI